MAAAVEGFCYAVSICHQTGSAVQESGTPAIMGITVISTKTSVFVSIHNWGEGHEMAGQKRQF